MRWPTGPSGISTFFAPGYEPCGSRAMRRGWWREGDDFERVADCTTNAPRIPQRMMTWQPHPTQIVYPPNSVSSLGIQEKFNFQFQRVYPTKECIPLGFEGSDFDSQVPGWGSTQSSKHKGNL